MLAAHFDRVVGSDASRQQLRAAGRAPGLSYVACLAEASPLASHQVDLVTVAQAFHWLDHRGFLSEARRVAAPGAALAIWGYGRLRAASAIERAIHHFQDGTVGPYWPPERKLVDAEYRGIALPIRATPAPRFAIEARVTLAEMLGYIRTWSAVAQYQAAQGSDPVELLEPELARTWGDPGARQRIVWPLFVRAGRWKRET